MSSNIFLFGYLLLFLIGSDLTIAQKQIISGFVKDSLSGEKLIGANLYPDNMDWGHITDEHGFFSITINSKIDTYINISYVGYKTRRINIIHLRSTGTVIFLRPDLSIPEIEIRGNLLRMPESGQISIDPQIVNRMPSFLGEKDLLRSLQFRSGVQTGKEGSAGLVVRGGSPDQNLFQVDGVPLYYFHHLGNLLSSFDPDAINSATFFKGGFPAHLGGRLSSITDIRLKDGNKDQLKGVFSLGTLAMKASIEGPLSKSSSFLFSVRRCNLDLLTRSLSYLNSNGNGIAGYTFYDGNIRIRQKLNANNYLYLTLFSNRDRIFLKFREIDEVKDINRTFQDNLSWSNNFGSIRLNHQYNNKNIADLSFSYSQFKYDHSIQNQITYAGIENRLGINSGTSVKDAIFKYDHAFYPNNILKIRYGSNITFHRYEPYNYESIGATNLKVYNSTEMSAYIESKLNLENIGSNLGLRYTTLPGNYFFHILEPRINIAYNVIPEKVMVSSSFTKMHQALHLVSDNSGGIPVDIWIPATSILPPEISNQFDVGIELHNFFNEHLSLRIDGFIKMQHHLLELIPGNSIYKVLESPGLSIESDGKSKIQGFEVELKKQAGKYSGWISYMYIRNKRQFEVLNNGKPFSYLYEKPHNLNVVLLTALNNKINLSLTWQFTSGMSTNLPIGRYAVPLIPGIDNPVVGEAHIYGSKNSIRLKPYHRLDLSVDFIKKWSDKKRIINLSLINAYNRKNPFFLFYMQNNSGETTLHQLCLFPILPSFNYRIEF